MPLSNSLFILLVFPHSLWYLKRRSFALEVDQGSMGIKLKKVKSDVPILLLENLLSSVVL